MASSNETVRFTDEKLLEMADGHSVVYDHKETIKILAKELLEARHAAEWMNDCIKGSCAKIRYGAEPCNGCALAAKDAEVARLVTECYRLKAALKPVLDACSEDAKCDAVREAQRIYKEGGVE